MAGALNCQKETARKIIENGGDYLLCVKDNQMTLRKEITDYVQDSSLCKTMDKPVQKEKNRGRIEMRMAYTTHEIDWLYGREEWSNMVYIGAINTRFETEKGVTNERHYYISSRKLSAEELLERTRGCISDCIFGNNLQKIRR